MFSVLVGRPVAAAWYGDEVRSMECERNPSREFGGNSLQILFRNFYCKNAHQTTEIFSPLILR